MATPDVFAAARDKPPLSIEELQGRRSLAVRQLELSKPASDVLARVADLLQREEAIEAEWRQGQEVQQQSTANVKSYVVRLHLSYLEVASCCTPSITGCYAPDGYHCEKPLEAGLRCDQGFLALWDDATGIEIESIEVLLTEQGLLIYQAYTNGHAADTSGCWAAAFRMLIDSGLVPAVLLPEGFPNAKTFNYIRHFVGTEPFGLRLDYTRDFDPSYASYFDSLPDKLRGGHDLLLSRANIAGLELPYGLKRTSSHGSLPARQIALALHRDLAAHLVARVIKRMEARPHLALFKILGGALALYLAKVFECGQCDGALLEAGLNLERWNQSQARGRERGKAAGQRKKGASELTEAQRQRVLAEVRELAHEELCEFCTATDMSELYEHNRMHFHELRHFLLALCHSGKPAGAASIGGGEALPAALAASTLEMLNLVMRRYVSLTPINALSRADGQALMRWVFRNEDRVWRHRGGRPGHETVSEFLGFLAGELPGVVLLASPLVAFEGDAPRRLKSRIDDDVVGYCIGEYVDEGSLRCYELIAAWVDPRALGLGFATQMYLSIFDAMTVPHALFELLTGSWDKIVARSSLLRALVTIGVHRLVVRWCGNSGPGPAGFSGADEIFEKLVVDVRVLRLLRHCKCGARA